MIRALIWTAVFLALTVVGGWWLWRRGRLVWGLAGRLGAELEHAGALAGVVEAAAAELDGQRRAEGLHPATAPPAPLAVFENPLTVAAERQATKAASAAQRAARRAAGRPGWARRVD